jgi:imidazoleglycerol phosphate synthase glutamine amidotransferase subunit HisH
MGKVEFLRLSQKEMCTDMQLHTEKSGAVDFSLIEVFLKV